MDRSAGRETRGARSSAVSPRQSPRRASTSDRRAMAARGRHAAEDRQLRSVSSGDYAAPLVLRGLFWGVDFRPGCFFGGGRLGEGRVGEEGRYWGGARCLK